MHAQQHGHLAVPVGFHHVYRPVPGQEIPDFIVEGQGPDAQVVGGNALVFQQVPGFGHGRVGGAVGNDADFGARPVFHGPGEVLASQAILLLDAVHHAVPDFGVFGVTGIFVVPGAPGEVGRARTTIPHHRAVGDAVAVHVQIAAPGDALFLFPSFQVFFPEHLAPVHVLVGVGKGLAHPVVHAQVQVAHHEHRGLEPLGDVESAPAEFEGLVDVRREEEDVLGIAVAGEVDEEDVALLGAGRQARAGPHPLDVPHDHGDFGVIGQADGLGHQAEAGAGGGGHGPQAGPTGPNGHVDGRQFILRLDDHKGVLAIRPHPITAQVVLQGFGQVRGGGDGVPADELDPAKERAQGRGGVAVGEDKPLGRLHGRDPVGVPLLQMLFRPTKGGADHAVVELYGLGLAPEVEVQSGPNGLQVDAQEIGQHAHIHHVGDVIPQPRGRARFSGQPVHRHRISNHVFSQALGTDVVGIKENPAGHDLVHVVVHRGGVHGDDDFVFVPAGQEAVLVDPDGVPGGKSLDVGGEDVLPRNRNPHAKQGPEDGQVRRLAARSVDGGHGDGEVVDHLPGRGSRRRFRRGLQGHGPASWKRLDDGERFGLSAPPGGLF